MAPNESRSVLLTLIIPVFRPAQPLLDQVFAEVRPLWFGRRWNHDRTNLGEPLVRASAPPVGQTRKKLDLMDESGKTPQWNPLRNLLAPRRAPDKRAMPASPLT